MQGLFVTIDGHETRPKSKKQVKELVSAGLVGDIYVEATSVFGNEDEGPLDQLALGRDQKIYFVGPDPHTKRNFYGTIEIKDGKVKVS